MQRMQSKSKNCDWLKTALSEIRLLLENHSLEFHEIWRENS